MQEINQRLAGMEQRFTDINHKINQRFALSENRSLTRSVNAFAQLPDHRIEAPVNEDDLIPKLNNLPIFFPETILALKNLTGTTINQLLQFYDQPTTGNVPTRRFRLKKYFDCL
jgi:hypothetical protein